MKRALPLLLILLLAPATTAAQSPQPLGFGARAQDSPKGYFLFDARPGKEVRGRLLITNMTNRPKLVHLRAADAFTANSGGVEFTKQGGTPVKVGTWIKLGADSITLPASGARELDFTVGVPRDARPGDHLGGVVMYGRRPRRAPTANRNFSFRLLSRLAIAVQVRVPGERTPALAHTGTEITVSPVGAALQLDLDNSGNTIVTKTTGSVTVTQGERRLFRRKVNVGSFVPRTSIRYPLAWPGTPVEGTYHVSGTLRPKGAAPIRIETDVDFGEKKIREFREETGRQALETGTPPWVWMVLGFALFALAALFLLLLRTRRRAEDRQRPVAPAPPPPPRPPPVTPAAPARVAVDNGDLVDLNTAEVEELMTLPGIGRQAAERLVQYRQANGPFGSLEDLLQVDGFHRERVSRVAPHARL